MNKYPAGLVFLLFTAIIIILSEQNYSQKKEDIILGTNTKINSKILGEDRNIFVYLPASYNNSKNTYPVLYILDGEGHFQYTAGVAKFLFNMGRMPEVIVVGIPNTKRNRDFTIVPTDGVPEAGGGANFLKFMNDELFTYIDKEYRTQKYRILAGHSLCGMFCLYTLTARPDMFDAYIALSPWVIASDKHIMKMMKAEFPANKQLNKKLYMTAGSLEGNDLTSTIDELCGLLKEKAPAGFKWKYKLMQDEDHGSLVLPTLNDGLRFIYSSWFMSEETRNSGLQAILDHFKKISDEFGYTIAPSEFIMNQAGYFQLQNQKYEQAIEIFKKNIELYPESANVYDSCGEAFEKSGQNEVAKGYYAKAYDLGKANNDANLQIFKDNFERMSKALNTK